MNVEILNKMQISKNADLNEQPDQLVSVPCGKCNICCRGDVIRVMPHEDASQWETMPHPYFDDTLAIKHKNGSCVYLTDKGCSIHDNKPYLCKTFDCRIIAANTSYTKLRKLVKSGAISNLMANKSTQMLKDYPL